MYQYLNPRYELKFVEPRDRVFEFVDALSDSLEPDPNHPEGYAVSSLYFDDPELAFYYEKIDGVDPRFKARLRWYDDAPQPAFLELKHRKGDRLWKERARVDPTKMPGDLEAGEGGLDQPEEAPLRDQLRGRALRPWVFVRYARSVYLARTHPELRVTVDTDLCCAPAAAGIEEVAPAIETRFLPAHLAVLEIKFPTSLPLFVMETARAHGLGLRRYSKYCSALERAYPGRFERGLRLRSRGAGKLG